jgi:putative ABC transport system substrate-binding protein
MEGRMALDQLQRREVMTLIGSAAAAWPLSARAQQAERMRRVGMLLGQDESDPQVQSEVTAVRQEFSKLGWIEGRNLRLDIRFGKNDASRIRAYAADLVKLAPDILMVSTPAATRALQQETKTIPIVFTGIGDPIVAGVVASTAHPEGNATGFTNFLASFGGKWLELLKEAAPRIDRVALVFNPEVSTGGYFAPIEAAATTIGVHVVRTPYRNPAELESAITAFAATPNGGLLVLPPVPAGANLELILRLALQHRLPAIYTQVLLVPQGGLIAYGPRGDDLWRAVVSYVDRILRGAKVGDLPVQFPTKYDLAINLKTAKAIGLDVPLSLQQRADEVIE